jgi:hypothetical protein
MEEVIILIFGMSLLGTMLSLLLSIVALFRSRHIRNLRIETESLESRVRILWNEIVVSRRSKEVEQVAAREESVPTEESVPQPLAASCVESVPIAIASVGSNAVELHEAPRVSEPSEPSRPMCPQCHGPWNEKYCYLCGYRVASIHRSPLVHAPSLKVHQHPNGPEDSHQDVLSTPSLIQPKLQKRTLDEEGLESVIGGSWLNKIGVLLLVVGIAIFIGYSLAKLGPMGRLAIGFAVSACMLGIGTVVQRQVGFRTFAYGLIAGGWAGLYFVTYAMHGLEASRILENSTIAFLLLLAVAAGMILHSLYYRTEVVTGLAYFFGFVAIAISPVTLFSAVASVVLAASLLVIAYRYPWDRLAVFGIVCTYGVFAIRYSEVLHGSRIWLDFTTGHLVIGLCWLLFELFDIAIVAKGSGEVRVGRSLLPLNACGLIGLSIMQWGDNFETLYLLFGMTAVAYLMSSILRAMLRPVSTFGADTQSLKRLVLGGYEASITISAILCAIAIWQKYSDAGWRLNIAWLMEGEFLFLAGILLGQRFLRGLSTPVFFLVLMRFITHDWIWTQTTRWSALDLMDWTPLAILLAAIFYFNRMVLWRWKESELLVVERSYSFAATGLMTLVLGGEIWLKHNHLRPEYLGIAWLVFALLLMEVAFRARLIEFCVQSCLVGFLGICLLFGLNGFLIYPDTLPEATERLWIWLAPGAVLLYLMSTRMRREPLLTSQPNGLTFLTNCALAAASGMSLLFLWHALPAPLVAVGWGIFALLLIELGFHWFRSDLRWHGYIASALMLGRIFFANLVNPGVTAGISHRLLTVGPIVILCYYLASRLSDAREQHRMSATEPWLGRLYLYAAALVLVVLIRFELGRVLAVLGWGVLGVILLYIGLRFKNIDLRWQSYLIALLTFGRSWGTNFFVPEGISGVFTPTVIGSIVIASLYLCQLLCPRTGARFESGRNNAYQLLLWMDANARVLYSLLATVLLGALLFYEMPGRLLTAAWGIEGAILLLIGFALRDRVFRLTGLSVLGVCLPKLFLYDLRHMETPYRIFSFLLLGFLLIAVSWVYTRFKSQVKAYL